MKTYIENIQFNNLIITIVILFISIILLGCVSQGVNTVPVSLSEEIIIATSTNTPNVTPTASPRFETPVISISPDKNWKIIGITDWDAEAIIRQDGKIRWELDHKPEKYNWSEWSYIFYRWSKESNFVYLSIQLPIDGFLPFYQGAGLYLFNLSDGNMTEILPPDLSTFSLSPDENLIIYTSYSNSSLLLKIRNIKNESEKELSLNDYDNAGRFIWAPDQTQIVFSISKGSDWTDWNVSLALANLQDLSSTIIYDNQQQSLRPEKWLNNTEIVVSSNENFYIFNLITKELRPFVTPTSTP